MAIIIFAFPVFEFTQNQHFVVWKRVNPLPDMSILGFSNTAANKDMKNRDKWEYNYLIE